MVEVAIYGERDEVHLVSDKVWNVIGEYVTGIYPFTFLPYSREVGRIVYVTNDKLQEKLLRERCDLSPLDKWEQD